MLTTFAGAGLDRAGERRADAAWVGERLADPASQAVVVRDGAVVADGARLARFALGELRPASAPVLLGLEGRAALFAVEAEDVPRGRSVGLREAGALLEQDEGGLAAYASGLVNWHRTHPRCARCGAATEVAEAGFLRVCPNCAAHHHPRTDPVVIMLVTDGRERVMLGRQPQWPAGRYSALAGFVEPGESLEEAVAREVWEEAGVEIRAPRYIASQPWPFPSSLMLGFFAEYAGGEPQTRDAELEDVRWFARDELADTVLPPPLAIARRLIDAWLEPKP